MVLAPLRDSAATADRTRIDVTCDGASDLGDFFIIANAGQDCEVPLLKGANYAVRANAPLEDIAVSDDNAAIYYNDNLTSAAKTAKNTKAIQTSALLAASNDRASASFDIDYSLEYSLEECGDGDWRIVTSPADVGVRVLSVVGGCCTMTVNELGFSWNCDGDCGCGGYDELLELSVEWCGYRGRLEKWLSCGCEIDDESPRPSSASVSLSFSRQVAFYEAAYTNAEGVALHPNPPNVVLTCRAHGGEHGGRLSMRVSDGGRMLVVSGNNPNMGREVAAGQAVVVRTVYKPRAHSTYAGDVGAWATLTENISGATRSAHDALTVVELATRTVATIPANRTRHEVGVGERVNVSAYPPIGALSARATRGQGWSGGDGVLYEAAHTGGADGVTVSAKDSSYLINFNVLEPTGYDAEVSVISNGTQTVGEAGDFAMVFDLTLLPTMVSFDAVEIREVGKVATDATGYFAEPAHSNLLVHSEAQGANAWVPVLPGNKFQSGDTAGVVELLPPWGGGGTMTWPIPNVFRVKNSGSEGKWFCDTDQRVELSPDGTVRVEKFGRWVSFATDRTYTKGESPQ